MSSPTSTNPFGKQYKIRPHNAIYIYQSEESSSTSSSSSVNTPPQSPGFPTKSPTYEDNLRNSGGKYRNSRPRRRNKNTSPEYLLQQRIAVTCRERKRVHVINAAYDELRNILPPSFAGKPLTKINTLKTARNYIECLADVLKSNNTTNSKID